MKRVLVIAYYFPPMGLSGVQRTVKFIKYLPEHGWEPHVLTVRPVLYYAEDRTLLEETGSCRITRTGSLDPLRIAHRLRRSARKQSIRETKGDTVRRLHRINRHLLPWLSLPDTKLPWIPFAIHRASRIISERNIDVILTTSPPHSAHLAGFALKRLTGIPWVADFRENWLAESYEKLPTSLHRIINKWMMKRVLREADRLITVSGPITGDLKKRSGRDNTLFSTISNGFDRDDFSKLRRMRDERFRITYCGTMSPIRNPEPFLRNLALLFGHRPDLRQKIRVFLVGSVYNMDLKAAIHRLGLENEVVLTGYLPHHRSLEQLINSDLLLLLIDPASSPGMVTGKIYEYLVSGVPILGLIPSGEAERLILTHNRGRIVYPGGEERIQEILLHYYNKWKAGDSQKTEPDFDSFSRFDRRYLAKRLAGVFDAFKPEEMQSEA